MYCTYNQVRIRDFALPTTAQLLVSVVVERVRFLVLIATGSRPFELLELTGNFYGRTHF
jgi:hypothetical protein